METRNDQQIPRLMEASGGTLRLAGPSGDQETDGDSPYMRELPHKVQLQHHTCMPIEEAAMPQVSACQFTHRCEGVGL